jgi:hypothetical protein
VVPLFTTGQIREAMNLLSGQLEEDILRLFLHVLTISYLNVGDQFHQQTEIIVTVSPLRSLTTIASRNKFQ